MQKAERLLGSVLSLGKDLLTSRAVTKGLKVGSKEINSEIGKNLINEGIKYPLKL